MQEIKILEKVILEVKDGFYDKSYLLAETQKELFKEVIVSADNLASIVRNLSEKDSLENEESDNLNIATNSIFNLYDIDKDILIELCEYSGLNKKQVKVLLGACSDKQKTSNKAICNLFESTALETDFISYHKNKSLFTKNSKVDSGYQQFDSFIEYLVTDGTNSLILEQIARLSIYQKQQLNSHLEQNLKLQNIYTKYVETGKISKSDIEYSKKQIEKGILKNLKENPIQVIQEMDGTIFAKTVDKSVIKDTFISGKAPATFIDAWGVSDGNLLGYCVTDNKTFDSQFNQIVRIADGIENGLSKNLLQNINTYELKGFCSSVLSEDSELTSTFNSSLNEMLASGSITKQEFMGLKYSAINKELLNIVRLTPDNLYQKLVGKISLGFHSDGSPLVSLKEKDTQVKTSTDGIFNAINVLAKIAETNPTLHKIETVFSTVANNLAEGYSLAYTANVINGTATELSTQFDKAEESLLSISKILRRANSRNVQNFRFSTDKESVILSEYEETNSVYQEQQLAIGSDYVSDQGFLKLTTAKHDVTITSNMANTVLGGHYGALVTQSLFVDCLKFKIDEVIERAKNSPSENIHIGSTKQIIKAYKEGIEKAFDMTDVIDKLKSHQNLIDKMVSLAGDLHISIPPRSNIKPR